MRNLKPYTCIGLALSLLIISSLDLTGASGPLELLSIKNASATAPVSASGNSLAPIFTADGTKVVFVSQAANLVTNDHNGPQNDVFIRNLTNGVTTLVSVNINGQVSANGASDLPVASSHGHRIAFVSTGTDFGVADTNDTYDIVWRDVEAHVTKLLSVGTSGAGNNLSLNPSISADGRWVAFESRASNLVTNDNNGKSDIFLRDTETDTTILVSVNSNRLASSFGDSQNAVISANGKKVAYVSRPTDSLGNNIVPNTNNHRSDLYVFDVDTLQNRMIKLWTTNIADVPLSPASALNVLTYNHALSADGRYLTFQASHPSTNQLKVGIYWVDLETDTILSFDQKWEERLAQIDPPVTASIATTNVLGLVDLSGPSLSADGQVLVFEGSYRQGGQVLRNIWAWWPGIDEIRRLTNSVSESVNNKDLSPSVSADGRFVVAHSTETGLFVTDLSDFSTKESLGDDDLPGAVLSPDGSLLAFQTRTDGLVTNEYNQSYDVFIRDLSDDSPALISTHAEGMASVSSFGWSGFVPRGLSDDGRYVVFTSSAALTTNDQNSGVMDVFVRDLESGSTELISVNFTGTQSGNGNSFSPSMSADGRYVVFESYATNLVETNALLGQKIFLRDRELAVTHLLSRGFQNSTALGSYGSTISADGRYAVFQSHYGGMVPNDSGVTRDTFIYEVNTKKLTRISTINGPTTQDINSAPVISGNGNLAVFHEKQGDFSLTFLYNSSSNQTFTIFTNTPSSAGAPYLAITRDGTRIHRSGTLSTGVRSYDVANRLHSTITNALETSNRPAWKRLAANTNGRYLTYSSHSSILGLDTNGTNDVYVFDFETQQNILVSINKDANGAGNGISDNVSISLDGRFVAFQSTASNLVEGDDNNTSDIFVRDLVLNTTTRVSSGGGSHSNPLISANGRVVVFSSGGNNPVFGDFNNSTDAYAVRLTIDNGSTDSDEDGMSDVWEFTMFGDLSRDGTGDADQDGLSDLNEFRAGTHPLDDQSTFAGQILTPAGDGSVNISWTMAGGNAYRVEYRDSLTEGEWALLEGTYAVEGNTATQTDIPPAGTDQRYYRIVIVDNP